MKKTALFLLISMLAAFVPAHAESSSEYIYVSYKDTSVRSNQPETNYGEWISAETDGDCIAYYSFDFSEYKSDDPLVLEEPNPRLGFWYEADVTKVIAAKYRNNDKKINMQVRPTMIDNSNMTGRFYTREAQFNRPYLKIMLSGDKKTVVSAKLYLFGGTSSTRVEINELKDDYDENTVNYKTKPLCGERIGYAYRNAELSGRPQNSTVIETVDGMKYETAMGTTLKSYAQVFTESETWDEIYDRANLPTVQQVIDDFKKHNPDGEHPRILGGKSDWERTRRWYKEGNEFVVKWAERVLSDAEKSIANVDTIHKDFTLNSSGSDMEYRGADIPVLGLAYQLTFDKKYAEAAYKKMEIMANYSHWNATGKDLNLGDCAKNVGTAFDLVYDALTEEEKSVVVSGIMRHVINARLGKPNTNTNNWNPVTNGGMGIAAIAIMNEQPYKAAEMIVQSVSEIPKSLMEYYPDGSFPEGMGYWSYMTSNLFGFTAALEQNLGTSYKLCEFPGLSQTGYLPIYMQGPTKKIRFRYGDDSATVISEEIMFYLAKRYDNPDFAEYQLNCITENNAYITLAPYWCDDSTFEDKDMYSRLPEDRVFDGHMPIYTARSAWDDSNALFMGIKGGFPQISHSDLDIGTFLVSALGVEWSSEIYPRTFRVGFPSQSRMTRYMFYANSPQGNNTLIFNPGKLYPDMEYGQSVTSHSKFEKSYSDENCTFSILDMSDAYRRYSGSVKRGLALINNRREFLIQDEIESGASNLTYWFMHTNKETEINGNTAILKSGSKRLYCKILAPADAEFELMSADALPRTPTIADYDNVANENYKKLAIKTETTGKDKIAVWMVPLTEYDKIPTVEPVLTDLDKWPMPEGEITRLSGVKVNGEDFAEFAPDKLVYDIITEGRDFDVEAADENVSVRKIVNQGSITLECSSPGKKTARYVFNQLVTNDLTKITFEASDVPQIANAPENTLDNDFSTRWASTNEQWIKYDLGEAAELNSISVAFYQGDTRMYNFKIEVSEDGNNYETVFDGKSSGVSDEFTKYEFTKRKVRFVKITCNESNENTWNNLSEVAFGYAD